MISYKNHLKEILLTLDYEGILQKIILIGSWCLLFYKHLFDDFEPTIRTTDIDLLI